MDNWYDVRILLPWFSSNENLVDDRFDDIGGAITNSSDEVDLDIMSANRKTSKPSVLSLKLPSSNHGNKNPDPVPENRKDEGIEWKRTDNEDEEKNNEQAADDFEDLLSNSSQANIPRSATPYFTGTITPIVGFVILCR